MFRAGWTLLWVKSSNKILPHSLNGGNQNSASRTWRRWSDMLGECDDSSGKESSIIYHHLSIFWYDSSGFLQYIRSVYMAFACEKSQSFLTKMQLACTKEKMCLEWSPGDRDGRFLRMAEASWISMGHPWGHPFLQWHSKALLKSAFWTNWKLS